MENKTKALQSIFSPEKIKRLQIPYTHPLLQLVEIRAQKERKPQDQAEPIDLISMPSILE